MKRIIEGLIKEKDGVKIPNIVFTKGGGLWIESIADIGCDAVGLDWTMDIGIARQKVGHKVALQGNIDPSVLFSNPAVIRNEVEKVLASYGFGSGHVFNLGHGISQFTDPANAAALVEAVHELSRKYH
jgi:uroporphyrinogen decarboxylase